MIYEGTNGVQALDLIGRKIAKDGGAALTALLQSLPVSDTMQEYMDQANQYLLSHAQDPQAVAGIAADYLNLLALVIQSALMTKHAAMDADLLSFYQSYALSDAQAYLAKVLSGTEALMGYDKLNKIIKDNQ
jgi:anion-transporting  ArsA/GET3 family ATPase